jgi:hypothetical protein
MMKIKSYILVFLLIKIILTVKSDSCKKDEPGSIEESITQTVQKEDFVYRTSISMHELDFSGGIAEIFLEKSLPATDRRMC